MEGGALSPSLNAAMRSLLAIPFVEHVFVSNAFGLAIARVSALPPAADGGGGGDDGGGGAIDPAPLEAAFAIVFAKAAEGAEKLSLGRARAAVLVTNHFVLVQASLAPLVVAAVARPGVDVDALAAAVPALATRLEPLRAAAEACGV